MDGILINKNIVKQWVESFLDSKNNEMDKHIDDLIDTPIPKSGWIVCAFKIFTLIKNSYPNLQVIMLIHQKCRSNNLLSVKATQLRGLYTPPSIILYRGPLNSMLCDNVVYSESISNQFNMNAYIRNEDDEWEVFLTDFCKESVKSAG